MGTRSLTRFMDGDRVLCTLYRQFDGYPSGHGASLKEVLDHLTECNGITVGSKKYPHFNGAGELPIITICRLKEQQRKDKVERFKEMKEGAPEIARHYRPTPGGMEPGGFYLVPNDEEDCGQAYTYTLTPAGVEHPVRIQVVKVGWGEEPDKVLFEGPITEFKPEDFED